MPLVIVARALLINKNKFVWHVREPSMPSNGLRYYLIRSVMLKAPRLIFISNADKFSWVGSRNAHVVQNFVNTKIYKPIKVGGISPKNTIVYLGMLKKVKGVFVLLKALEIVKKSIPDIKCFMPGSILPEPRSKMEYFKWKILPKFGIYTPGVKAIKLIKKLEIESVCRLYPVTNDVRNYINKSSVLIFPAIRPHFARPIIEAASMGVPSIASNLSGVDELVDNEKTGLLFKNKDHRDLAKKIIYLLENQDKIEKMGKNAREKAEDQFSERNIWKIEECYNNL